MPARSVLVDAQRAWARRQGIVFDAKGRTSELEGNLFQALDLETEREFGEGAGGELGKDGEPGDLQALHSSAALACNVFDAWRRRQLEPLARACGADSRVSSLRFEAPFPTGLGPPAYLDVILEGPRAVPTAIESKFTETYSRGHDELSERYLDDEDLWKRIEGVRDVAEDLVKDRSIYTWLGAPQLIKHLFALTKAFGPRGFRLLYLWFDDGSETGRLHGKEADLFRRSLGDVVSFDVLTHQELFRRLQSEASEEAVYLEYLRTRYFPEVGCERR